MNKLHFILFLFYATLNGMDIPSLQPTIEDLFEAIEKNELSKVNKIIQLDPTLLHTPHEIFYIGGPISALHYAAAYGRARCTELLLQNNASANSLTSDGASPLHYVSTLKTAQILLNHKAIVHQQTTNLRKTPLWMAFNCNYFNNAPRRESKEIASLLIKNGAKINHRSKDGDTFLHYSLFHCYEAIDFLLAHKADVTKKDALGLTALQVAFKLNHPKVFSIFEKYGFAFFPRVNPRELLYKPSDWNLFINDKNNIQFFNYWAPLYSMAKKNLDRNGSIIAYSEGCVADNLSQTDLNRFLPDLRIIDNHLLNITVETIKALRQNQINLFKEYLVTYPWVVRYSDRFSSLMISMAINSFTIDSLKILLEADIDPNTKIFEESLGNFLHYAVKTNKAHVIELLAEYGVDLLQVNQKGATPMHLAMRLKQTECIAALNKALGKEFRNTFYDNKYTRSKELLRQMQDCNIPIDQQDNRIVHIVSSFLDPARLKSFFKILKNKNADFNIKNKKEETPLFQIIATANFMPRAIILLSFGADPNVGLTCNNDSLLDIAIKRKNLSLIELLLSYGAIVSKKSIETFSGTIHRRNSKKEHILRLLQGAYDRQSCCICFEPYDNPTNIRSIPCVNRHSEFICQVCYSKIAKCPLCNHQLMEQNFCI